MHRHASRLLDRKIARHQPAFSHRLGVYLAAQAAAGKECVGVGGCLWNDAGCGHVCLRRWGSQCVQSGGG